VELHSNISINNLYRHRWGVPVSVPINEAETGLFITRTQHPHQRFAHPAFPSDAAVEWAKSIMRSNRSTDKPGCRSASVCSFSSGGTPEGSEPFANASGLGAGSPRDWPARVVQSSSVGDRSERANLQPRSEIGAKPETVRCLRGLLLSADFSPSRLPPRNGEVRH